MADASIAIALRFVDQATAPMTRALQSVESHTRSLTRSFQELTWVVRTWAASMVVGYVREWGQSFVDAAGRIERMREVLRGFTGSTEEMRRSLDYIFELGSRVYGIEAVMDAFMKLKSVGVDPLNGSLKAIIDALVAFGQTTPEQLNLAIIGFQQMIGKGTASMEEMRRQISERIPTAMMGLAREMGISYEELTRRVAAGAVDSMTAFRGMVTFFEKEYGGTLDRLSKLWDLLRQRMENFGTIFKSVFMESGGFLGRLEGDLDALLDHLYGYLESYTGQDAIRSWAEQAERAVYGLVGAFRDLFGAFSAQDVTRWLDWINDLAGGFSSVLIPVLRDTVGTVNELARALDELSDGEGSSILGQLLGAGAIGASAKWGTGSEAIGKWTALLALMNSLLENAKKEAPDHWLTEYLYRWIPTSSDFVKAARDIADAIRWVREEMSKELAGPAIDIPGFAFDMSRAVKELDGASVTLIDRFHSDLPDAMSAYVDAGHDVGIVNEAMGASFVTISKDMQSALDAYREFSQKIDEKFRLAGLTGRDLDLTRADIDYERAVREEMEAYERLREAAVTAEGKVLASIHELRKQHEENLTKLKTVHEEERAAIVEKYAERESKARGKVVNEELERLKQIAERWRELTETPIERYQKMAEEVAQAHRAGVMDNETYARSLKVLREEWEELHGVEGMPDHIGRAKKVLKDMGEEGREAAKEADAAWEAFAQNTHNALRDMFLGLKSPIESLWDFFKQAAANALAWIANQKIVIPIAAQVLGAFGISLPVGATPGSGTTVMGLPGSGGWIGKIPGLGFLNQPIWGGTGSPGSVALMNAGQYSAGLPTAASGPTWGQAIGYGLGGALSVYGGVTSLMAGGGWGNYLGGGMQLAGGGMALSSLLPATAGMSWLGPAGLLLGGAGSIIASIFGGKDPDDVDLHFGLGTSFTGKSTGSELSAADRATFLEGLGAVNIRKGDYLSDEEAIQIEEAIAEYYDNWFAGLNEVMRTELTTAIQASSLEVHWNDIQEWMEDGGVEKIFSEINEQIFKKYGEIVTKGALRDLATAYEDYWQYVSPEAMEEMAGKVQGAESFEELQSASAEVVATMSEVASAMDAVNAVASGDDLSIYGAAMDAINQKYDDMTERMKELGVEVDKTNIELARQAELDRLQRSVLISAYQSLLSMPDLTPEEQWGFVEKGLEYKYNVDVTPEMIQQIYAELKNGSEEYILGLTGYLDSIGVPIEQFISDVVGANSALDDLEESTHQLEESARQAAAALQAAYADFNQSMYSITSNPEYLLQTYGAKYNLPGVTAGDISNIYNMIQRGQTEDLALAYAQHMGINLNDLSAEEEQAAVAGFTGLINDTASIWNELNKQVDKSAASFAELSSSTDDLSGTMGNIIDDLNRQVNTIRDAYQKFYEEMTLGGLAPVQSWEAFQRQYDISAGSVMDAESYQSFLDFARTYLDTFSAYGPGGMDYQQLWEQVLQDASNLQEKAIGGETDQAAEALYELFGRGGLVTSILEEIREAIASGREIVINVDGRELARTSASASANNPQYSSNAGVNLRAGGSVNLGSARNFRI